ncbi:glycosyl hydrolase [Flavivirga abyssicola]|uniref:glycoside hydrolase family 26 protein n=1 Tax=Flavivirga abyssicola TaxID=3063533 RepID=UPI0026E05A00|nr:glycosyl hydrolase [Flavivirga sp. MEBiC07777]WVK12585.1 glycosyl hydrolase [Flavivirga sp. MEBiC07777]
MIWKNIITKTAYIFFLVFFYSCKPLYNSEYKKPVLVDNKTTRLTKKLHKKLTYISKEGFAIGHQDATSYGIGWNSLNEMNTVESDVFEIVKDNPAVYGFDISKIELESIQNLDSVPFNAMRNEIITAHKNGGIITISWHADNPTTNGNSWDTKSTVNNIFTDKTIKTKYELWIEHLAAFIKTLQYKGKSIPVLFRPFHEMNGFWFWWGDPNCNAIDYIRLWRKTVRLLRDEHKVHNLLYVYSPNKLNPNDDFMKYYPGDNYVDILGIDIYDFKNAQNYIKSVVKDLALVKKIATSKNKLYAFTETGLEKIPTPNWFTQVLYPNIKDSGISWILFWRNAHLNHYYVPHKEHENAEDFKVFANYPKTLFLKDIQNLEN